VLQLAMLRCSSCVVARDVPLHLVCCNSRGYVVVGVLKPAKFVFNYFFVLR
jgi:hypothetical protein